MDHDMLFLWYEESFWSSMFGWFCVFLISHYFISLHSCQNQVHFHDEIFAADNESCGGDLVTSVFQSSDFQT